MRLQINLSDILLMLFVSTCDQDIVYEILVIIWITQNTLRKSGTCEFLKYYIRYVKDQYIQKLVYMSHYSYTSSNFL